MLDEINHALSRPKFKKYLRVPVSRFIEVIGLAVTITETVPIVSNLPDSKDNFLIALAQSSRVAKIVTGDKELLALSPYRGIEFVSLSDFRKLLKIK